MDDRDNIDSPRDEKKLANSDISEEGYDSESEVNNESSNCREDQEHPPLGSEANANVVASGSANFEHAVIRGESSSASSATIETTIQAAQVALQQGLEEIEDEKHCWVCFASEEDDPTAVWTHPCRCRGTAKWVHQACIQRWVDEKQKGNTKAGVECPQCGTPYVIKFPSPTFFVAILDSGDLLIQKSCPVITGCVFVGSIYWTCVTFGAVTLMMAVGHERSLILMERVDPLLLLVSLPLVPVGLIIGQMIRWEEAALKMLRTTVPKTPILRSILPVFAYEPENRVQSSLPPFHDPVSVTRIFCGALLFPTVAAFLGARLYKNVPSQLQRTLLGGLTFAVIKGAIKIYHKQHTYIRQCQKKILDFTEDSATQSNRI